MASSYEIYADESRIDSSGSFYFGALVGSSRRIEILRDCVRKFRAATGCVREMKWTRVSRAYLEKYKAFVDIVLKDSFARFSVLEICRDVSWYRWEHAEEQRFWKAYHVFLRFQMNPLTRYSVVLDYKDGKRHRWSKLRFAMNALGRRNFELKKDQILSLTPRDSREEDMLQLVDVILGASTSDATAAHKVELAEYVRQQLKPPCHRLEKWAVDLTKTKRSAS